MTNRLSILTTTALAGSLWASTLAAEVTSQQVWDDLESYLTDFGYAVTATETATGSGLSVTDIAMSYSDAEVDTTVTMEMSALTLTNNGDGTVTMAFPPNMPITIDAGAEDARMVFDYALTDLVIQVSGSADTMTYDYSGPRMALTLAEMTEGGETIGRDKLAIEVVMTGLSGTSTSVLGNLRALTQEMGFDGLSYTVMVNDVDGPGSGKANVTGALSNLSFAGTSSIPLGGDMTQMSAFLKAGFAVDGTMSYQNGTFRIEGEDEGQPFTFDGASDTAEIGIRMSEAGMSYSASGTGTKVSMVGGDVPLPVSFAAERTGFSLSAPVSASEAAQDFGLSLEMANFTMADLLWNMFDPGVVLPRDPATLALEATGKGKLMIDLLDEDAMMAAGMSDTAPAELNALTVSNITLQAAGATLTGTGDFTFDNTDLVTFDGFPRPIGGVDLQVAGANGLIDNLIRMGLLTEEDAMGARMMMSMFGVPGDAPDTLNSKLEINEQGHILANGMRIQ